MTPGCAGCAQVTANGARLSYSQAELAQVTMALPETLSATWCNAAVNTLLECCRAKAHKSSVQGIISAASMVAIAQAQSAEYPLPQTVLVQAPTNLRKQVCTAREAIYPEILGSNFSGLTQPEIGMSETS